ncbi:MAG TPA: YdcF family protein [Xanthobacteraceae bacterium]|jgi:uncharacterized SAM-binding protein YcdF (DUF218 family)|nr:YdcF family protein [Xanthobacteraceae bacterium]
MYFALSKTLGDLLIPSTLVLLIQVCGVVLWWQGRLAHLGRWLTVGGLILLVIGGQPQVSALLLLPLENRFPPWDATGEPLTGIVVLGGAINTHISTMRKEISLNAAANRLVATVLLQRRYPTARVVFSGGNSNLIFGGDSESKYAARLLEALGVPADHLVIDAVARNTFENAVNAKKIVDPKPGERWLLVTSASHMPRAVGLFRAAGFPIEAYPVDYRSGSWRDLSSPPTLSVFAGFTRIDLAFHEWAGLTADWLIGRTPVLLPQSVNTPSDAARRAY